MEEINELVKKANDTFNEAVMNDFFTMDVIVPIDDAIHFIESSDPDWMNSKFGYLADLRDKAITESFKQDEKNH